MKIALTSKKFLPLLGGSVIFATMLASAFQRAGHEVKVMTRTAGEGDEALDFEVIRNPDKLRHRELAIWADVLLQVESSWKDAMPFLLRGKPWFPTLHRGRSRWIGEGIKSFLLLGLESAAFRLGNTIAVSRFALQSWGLKGSVIPNPYDQHLFHPPVTGAGRDVDVLFVGRITRDKGVFILVDAIARLRAGSMSTPSLKIVFVGSGYSEDELKAEVKVKLPGMLVDFAGKQTPAEVAGWMRRARILAFPTTPDWLEASPLTPLEAAACGCRVVASDVGGTSENIPPGHLTTTAGSVESLSDALLESLTARGEFPDGPTLDFLSNRSTDAAAVAYLKLFSTRVRR